MDISEIRAAFAISEQRFDRIRRFRQERIDMLTSRHAELPPIPANKSVVVLHLLPTTTLDPVPAVDISRLAGRQWGPSPGFPDIRSRMHSFNFDGFLVEDFGNDLERPAAYVQFFRSGAVEAARVQHYNYIGSTFEVTRIRQVKDYLSIQQELELRPPIYVMMTLIGVKGYSLIGPAGASGQHDIQRDSLLLPECVVDDFDTPMETVLRPAFDMLYQCAGLSRSLSYDESGNWIGDNVN
jgi:hypothetical protein